MVEVMVIKGAEALLPNNIIPHKSIINQGTVIEVQDKRHPDSPMTRYLIFMTQDSKRHFTASPDSPKYPLDDYFDDSLEGLYLFEKYEIVSLYGLPKYPSDAFTTNVSSRPLLWARKQVKKMTVAEISKELGYEVEVVKGDT